MYRLLSIEFELLLSFINIKFIIFDNSIDNVYYYYKLMGLLLHPTEIYTVGWKKIKFGANGMGFDGFDKFWTGKFTTSPFFF